MGYVYDYRELYRRRIQPCMYWRENGLIVDGIKTELYCQFCGKRGLLCTGADFEGLCYLCIECGKCQRMMKDENIFVPKSLELGV